MKPKTFKLAKMRQATSRAAVRAHLQKQFPGCTCDVTDTGVSVKKTRSVGAKVVVGTKSISVEEHHGFLSDLLSLGERAREIFVRDVYRSLRETFG